jgi:hypothetical protein
MPRKKKVESPPKPKKTFLGLTLGETYTWRYAACNCIDVPVETIEFTGVLIRERDLAGGSQGLTVEEFINNPFVRYGRGIWTLLNTDLNEERSIYSSARFVDQDEHPDDQARDLCVWYLGDDDEGKPARRVSEWFRPYRTERLALLAELERLRFQYDRDDLRVRPYYKHPRPRREDKRW